MELIKKYFTSPYYLLAVSLLTAVFWALGLKEYGVIIIGCIGLLSLYFCEDVRVLIASVILSAMSLTGVSIKVNLGVLIPLGLFVLLLGAGGFYTLYRKNFMGRGFKLHAGYLAAGVALAVLGGLLGGLLYPHFERLLLIRLFFKCFAVFALYFVCINFLKPDSINYFAKMMIFAVLVIAVEVTVNFSRTDDFWRAVVTKDSRLGWAASNTLANIPCIALPLMAYLFATQSKFCLFYYVMMFVDIALILFLFSRSNILIGIFVFFLCVLYLYKKCKKLDIKQVFISFFALFLLILLFFVAFYIKEGTDWLDRFMAQKDSGRLDIYKMGLSLFKKHPLFGIGIYSGAGGEQFIPTVAWSVWFFHSTPITILANFGIVGAVLFTPFFYKKYKLLLNFKNHFTFFAFLAVLSVELFGLVDVAFTDAYLNMFVFLFLACAEINNRPPKAKKMTAGIPPEPSNDIVD